MFEKKASVFRVKDGEFIRYVKHRNGYRRQQLAIVMFDGNAYPSTVVADEVKEAGHYE